MDIQLNQTAIDDFTARKRCKKLKKNKTPYEKIFRRLFHTLCEKHKLYYFQQYFVRINPKKYYILDFYVEELNLAFELDGEIHDSQIDYDLNRDNELMSKGIYVVRFKNKDILLPDFYGKVNNIIIAKIRQEISLRKKSLEQNIEMISQLIVIKTIHVILDEQKYRAIKNVISGHIKHLISKRYKIESLKRCL